MKRVVGISIFFVLVTAMGCASYTPTPVYTPNENCKLVGFRSGLEPRGVNGINWETDVATLKEMKSYRKDSSHGGIHFYLRAGDGYKLRTGKLIPLQYGFWRGKFYIGMVTTEQISDWDALKDSVFEKFGVGAKPFSNKEEYLWIGKDVTMALRYDENLKKGTYYIRSHSMEKRME